MGIKRVLAMMLATSMIFGSAMSVSAATSPEEGNDEPASTSVDTNTKDHTDKTVVAKITGKGAVITKVSKVGKNKALVVKNARNSAGKKVAVIRLGDGKKGVFNNTQGKKIKTVSVKSTKKVTVSTNAFKGSNVEKIAFYGKAIIRKNAFKGTKKAVKITFKKALKNYTFAAKYGKAFAGLKKGSKIVVAKSVAKTAAKKAAWKKALKKAGYTGTVKFA